jgi:hypothetical protein
LNQRAMSDAIGPKPRIVYPTPAMTPLDTENLKRL